MIGYASNQFECAILDEFSNKWTDGRTNERTDERMGPSTLKEYVSNFQRRELFCANGMASVSESISARLDTIGYIDHLHVYCINASVVNPILNCIFPSIIDVSRLNCFLFKSQTKLRFQCDRSLSVSSFIWSSATKIQNTCFFTFHIFSESKIGEIVILENSINLEIFWAHSIFLYGSVFNSNTLQNV